MNKKLKKYYCQCGKEITRQTIIYGKKRCKSCANKNRKYTKETCNKMKKASIKRWKDLEERNKQSKRFKGKYPTKETKQKMSLIHGGTGIPYENAGYTKEFTQNLKESIRKRDNYICQLCGMTEEEHITILGQVLHIHHIDYTRENCNPNNLITVCKQCHTRTNFNRNYWTKYFKYNKKSDKQLPIRYDSLK